MTTIGKTLQVGAYSRFLPQTGQLQNQRRQSRIASDLGKHGGMAQRNTTSDMLSDATIPGCCPHLGEGRSSRSRWDATRFFGLPLVGLRRPSPDVAPSSKAPGIEIPEEGTRCIGSPETGARHATLLSLRAWKLADGVHTEYDTLHGTWQGGRRPVGSAVGGTIRTRPSHFGIFAQSAIPECSAGNISARSCFCPFLCSEVRREGVGRGWAETEPPCCVSWESWSCSRILSNHSGLVLLLGKSCGRGESGAGARLPGPKVARPQAGDS